MWCPPEPLVHEVTPFSTALRSPALYIPDRGSAFRQTFPYLSKPSTHLLMTFDSLHKTRARNAAKMIRAKLASENLEAGIELIRHWSNLNVRSGIIAAYIPLHSEIDTVPLMLALADAGHTLALPCIKRKDHPLEFREYRLGDKLRGGAYGTKEPLRSAPLITPDIILLPLLAYSRIGARLGYGGGYYDRTLQQLRTKTPIFACALAYSGQEVPILPAGLHDEVLDGVLTETGFKDFSCV